jgi:hypothetical protein
MEMINRKKTPCQACQLNDGSMRMRTPDRRMLCQQCYGREYGGPPATVDHARQERDRMADERIARQYDPRHTPPLPFTGKIKGKKR